MKHLKYLLFLLFIPCIVLAKNDVEIKSVTLIDKSEEVTELESAKYNGLKIDFSLKYVNKDDYAKYKIIIKNNSDKDYEIDNQTTFNDGEFIKYEYIIDNNAKILKPHEELTMDIIITYYKDIDNSKFVDGKYSEKNNVSIELSNDNIIDEGEKNIISFVTNPETNSNEEIIFIIISTILCILIILSLKNIKTKTYMLIIIILLTPIFVYALEKIKIDVETYIEIDKNDIVVIKTKDCDHTTYKEIIYNHEFNYLSGMTFREYMNSNKFNELSETDKEIFTSFLVNSSMSGKVMSFEYYEYATCEDYLNLPEDATDEEIDEAYEKRDACVLKNRITEFDLDSKIISKKKGFYNFIDNGLCVE